ncbi:MAG: DUF6691 family protein [Pseudomonadota bacterium]
MRLFFAALVGGLFGTGLMVSGMTDTEKVRGFLDVFGAWDPTLMFVMAGAIGPMAIAWWWAETHTPLLAERFPDRATPDISRPLVLGSALFGIGWGLAGLCPGPALAVLGFGGPGVWIFGIAMVLGMWIAPRVRGRLDAPA